MEAVDVEVGGISVSIQIPIFTIDKAKSRIQVRGSFIKSGYPEFDVGRN